MFNAGAQICHPGPLCFLSQPRAKYCLCPISKPPLRSHCSLSTLCVTFVSSTALKLLYLVIDCLLVDWSITLVLKHLQGMYYNAKLCLGCWAGIGSQGSGMAWGTKTPQGSMQHSEGDVWADTVSVHRGGGVAEPCTGLSECAEGVLKPTQVRTVGTLEVIMEMRVCSALHRMVCPGGLWCCTSGMHANHQGLVERTKHKAWAV